MEFKTKLETVDVGTFDVDSIKVKNGEDFIQICFDKKLNISKYIGKYVVIKSMNEIYTIEESIPFSLKK
jgi:hypothetical protein